MKWLASMWRIKSWRGHNVRIATGMLWVSAFVLIGKMAGAGREMAIAAHYGVSESVDAYLLAMTVVSWVPAMVVSLLNAILVPLLHRLPRSEADSFTAQIVSMTLLFGLLLSVLIHTVVPDLVGSLAAGFSDAALADLSRVLKWLSLGTLLMLLNALFSALLLARERHVNTLLESLPALGVLVLVLLRPGGYAPLVAGVLIGLVAQCLCLMVLLLRDSGLALSFSKNHAAWGGFARSFGTLIIGTFALSLALPIDQLVAARLGEGSVASLGYATRLLALGAGLGATAVARATLPVLSGQDASLRERLSLARQWFFILLAGGIVGVAIAWPLAPTAVSLVFERGAFDAQDSARVVGILRLALFQLPFYFSGIVIVQMLSSVGAYRTVVVSSFIGLATKLATVFWLAGLFGVGGVALSTSLMYLATCIFLFYSLQRLASDA